MSLGKKCLFGLCVVVTIGAVGEFGARIVLGLGDPPLSQSHPSIEYMFSPNQKVSRFHNTISINAYGMRSEDFGERKKDRELRVLVFGDSVLNGGNLTDQRELATELLKDELMAQLGTPVTVGNVSAGSWGPGNWLAWAEEFGFFGADAIVLLLSTHDIADNPTFKPLNPDTHPQRKPRLALIEGVTRYLPRYLPSLPRRQPQHNRSTKPDKAGDTTTERIRQGAKDLRAFFQLAKKKAPHVIVLLHPTRKELNRGHPPTRAQILEIAKASAVPAYTLDAAFEQAINDGTMPYRDNIHINAAGQSVLFSVLVQALTDVGAIPDEPSP